MPMLFRRIVPTLIAVAALCAAGTARATVPVVMGDSWDGPSHSLQAIVDGLFGAGKINVATDYIGAKPGDEDPWFWVDDRFSSLLLTEVAGYADYNVVGWYQETGAAPILTGDGLHDGIVFDGPASAGDAAVVSFAQARTKFGFYLKRTSPKPITFYTNRLLNAHGTLHAPYDGNVQALIFDVSAWTYPNTWLVCWEDLDSGAVPGPLGQAATDNDYNDCVFEVTALGATPVQHLTIGALKVRYAH